MRYKSICCVCGQETPSTDNIAELDTIKHQLGFMKVEVFFARRLNNANFRSMNFCHSCSKKSYTIEELQTIGNYNQWSY